MKKYLFAFLFLFTSLSLFAQEPVATESESAAPQQVGQVEPVKQPEPVVEKPQATPEVKPKPQPEPKVEVKPAPKPQPEIKKPKVKQKPIGTVYVNDRLFLGVTRIPASGQQAIVTIQNGVAMQLLEKQKRYSKVRLEDGKEGWVRNLFISDTLPPSKQIPKLEKEKQALEKQIDALKQEMQQREIEQISPQEMFAMSQEKMALQAKIDEANAGQIMNIVVSVLFSIVALVLGFIIGYSVLAKRVKEKFNGMKVW